MQTLDYVSGLHNCRILLTPLVFRWGYVNTEKVLCCLDIKGEMAKSHSAQLSAMFSEFCSPPAKLSFACMEGLAFCETGLVIVFLFKTGYGNHVYFFWYLFFLFGMIVWYIYGGTVCKWLQCALKLWRLFAEIVIVSVTVALYSFSVKTLLNSIQIISWSAVRTLMGGGISSFVASHVHLGCRGVTSTPYFIWCGSALCLYVSSIRYELLYVLLYIIAMAKRT